MSITRHHAEWLSLIDVSGPFLSMPVLLRAFRSGLDAHDPDHFRELKLAHEEWEQNCNARRPDLAIHRAWIRFVLERSLGFVNGLLVEGQELPPGLDVKIEEHQETLRPDLAVIGPKHADSGKQVRFLIQTHSWTQDLDKAVQGSRWKASPATRMMELLHGTGIPLGLVTNGEHWMLVHAPRGETSGFASWYANVWMDEKITLQAFRSLLSADAFFNRPDHETPEALLAASAQDQQEVTDQLGLQVRRAVEVLIRSIDRINQDRGGKLLTAVNEKRLYEAALTVMMRLVFLFCAEERGLLLLGDPTYDQFYAVSTLRDGLRQAADRLGEEVLERRCDAWSRLLATFRAVHAGVDHEAMRLPAYGGTLFDPDRFPFLEGREPGTHWTSSPANPLLIDNRTVLHLLEALQILQVKVPGGGQAEARRLSFRALDIEQIGHVYEGLLDHTAVRAGKDRPVLGLKGTKDKEPEIELAELERLKEASDDDLIKFLKEKTGRSVSALNNALAQKADHDDVQRLRVVCGNDDKLVARVEPFAGLLREDTFGRPLVIPGGSVYVTEGVERRATGTHYTPRSLTEEIVQHTLDPLVFEGPAEGWPKEKWQLRSAREILDLKICDMAMGSGAFLVQTCRYLSERILEAWETELQNHPEAPGITPFGTVSRGHPGEALIPQDPDERLAYARRLICERCLYGVDKNPLAVEMAKLSLWLITLDKGRAFTFLDHALKCGDSLIGLHSLEQVENFHINTERKTALQEGLFASVLRSRFKNAIEKRKKLESFIVNTIDDARRKEELHHEVGESMEVVELLSNLLAGIAIATADGESLKRDGAPSKQFEKLHDGIASKLLSIYQKEDVESALEALRLMAPETQQMINSGRPPQQTVRRPFHWTVEFPEVLASENGVERGFSAIVSNPPFQGGQKITGNLGVDYRNFLVDFVASGRKGSADLCSYFFLQAGRLIRKDGMIGMLATNTIAQGDTREVGLDQLTQNGLAIPRAVASRKWPGSANLEVAQVWLRKGIWNSSCYLAGEKVKSISPYLARPGRVEGNPFRLKANEDKSFQGSIVLGMGFVLSPEEAEELILQNPANHAVLFPYLTGEDLNSRPDQSPSRWVINFRDWPLRRAEDHEWRKAGEEGQKSLIREGVVAPDYAEAVAQDYPDCLEIVRTKVKPQREKDNREVYRRRWWIYCERRRKLHETIRGMEQVMVRARVSHEHCIAFVPTGIVYSEGTVVFAESEYSQFALLQAAPHSEWLWHYASSLETRNRYTPSDCFETYPFPRSVGTLESIGNSYYNYRKSLMLGNQEGLTTTYNRFHNPDEFSEAIQKLRELRTEMDLLVTGAYGWNDLDLGHGFHETRQGIRFTISETARREVLDRLLALNHERYREELAQGLHETATKKTKASGNKKKNKQDDSNMTLSF